MTNLLPGLTAYAAELDSIPSDIDFNDAKEWGKEIKKSADGGTSLFMRDFGKKGKLFTHVFWLPGEEEGASH
jgi:hypothetical protein